jgi:hypothetical protein
VPPGPPKTSKVQPVTAPQGDVRPESAGRRRRNINPVPGVASISDAATTRGFLQVTEAIEGTMATREHHQIVETPTEARQAEPGPSVLALLTVSTGLAVLILGVVWFAFFRT